MPRTLVLEDFTPESGQPRQAEDRAPIFTEEARLAAYEEGYTAGWDDAAAAETQTRERIGADFANSLGELAFTFHEARAHVLQGVAPLLTLMVEKVLPDIAREGLAETLAGIVNTAAEQAASRPVELVINPENRAAVNSLLAQDPPLPLKIFEEPSLGPGQAYIRAGSGQEIALDLDEVLSEIRNAVSGFLSASQPEEQRENG